MTDRAVAIIDLDNIIHNYKIIKSTLRRSCKFMAVVKANAYGHGASTVATVLEQNGVKHFAVATVEEGIALRRAGITGDILILGYTEGDDCINAILSFNLIQAVSSPEYAEHLASYGKVRVHIKLDTGMSRLGLYCHNPSDSVSCADTAEKIYKNPNLSV